MRKSTKNNIIHGILIIFVIFFAIIASVTAALRDVTVQCMIARSVATELSKRLNADVRIKTFYITNDGTICVENVYANDLYGYPLFKIGQLNAKISLSLKSDVLRFKNIYIKDVWGNIVKYKGDKKLNATELFAQLKSGNDNDDDTDSGLHLKVDKLQIDNGHLVYWNQNKDDPGRKSMDYAHIDIDSIYGVFSKLEMRQDTIIGKVHTIRGKDRCGLTLKDGSGDVLFCEKSLIVDSLKLSTGESHVDLDLRFDYNNSRAYYEFVDSVYITSNIRQSTMLLSDLKYFAQVMEKMPNKLVFTCDYKGTVSDFAVDELDMYYGDNTHLMGDVALEGLPYYEKTFFDVTIDKLESSYDDIISVAIPSESVTVPLPEMLSGLGDIFTAGTFRGYLNNFTTSFIINSELGDIKTDANLRTDEYSDYDFIIEGNDIKINEILKTNDIADLTFELDLRGKGFDVNQTDFNSVLKIKSLTFRGNEFNDIQIYSDFDKKHLDTKTIISHRYLGAYLQSGLDFDHEIPEFYLNGFVKDADLVNLHLSDFDTIMLLSSSIDLTLSGNDIDNILGNLIIKNTSYYNGYNYNMRNFAANIVENEGVKDITIDCDFFTFDGSGIICFKEIADVLKKNVIHYFDIPSWHDLVDKEYNTQEFSFGLTLKDTSPLMRLFVPELYIASGTEITASYTNLHQYHSSSIESPEIAFNGVKFKNLDIRNDAKYNVYESTLRLEDIILRDTLTNDPNPISLENVLLQAKCANDTLNVNLKWNDDDTDDHNKALIKSLFTRNADADGVLYVKADTIMINDSIWRINDCNIVFDDDRIEINSLMMQTGSQSMALNGYYPKTGADSLNMVFNNVNVSNFDFITKGYNLDFDGVIDGHVCVSGLNDNLIFFSSLEVGKMFINKQEVGEVSLGTSWVDKLKAVYVSSDIYKINQDDEKIKSFDLNGYYYTQKKTNNLDFDLNFNKFNLATVSPFLSSVVSRMTGSASGDIDIKGSVEEPVITGRMAMADAGCLINFTNVYYSFNDVIRLTRDKFLFHNLVMRDTLGHEAVINGYIGHNHLRDFTFDISLKCDDFLALNIPADRAVGFYGTAVTDGTVLIQGPANHISMNIEAETKRGTEINIPLTSTSDMDNDFIVFVNKQVQSDTIVDQYVNKITKKDSGFTMNLQSKVTPDADVNIYLPMNMGSISSKGGGNINIGVTPNDFNLRGDYLVESGNFVFTLEMMKRTFTLRRGGTIRWTGDPTDADIDVVGVYRTKTSLTSLGPDFVDSTAVSNNINVDCIIRLSDKLMNPTLTFGIEIPNATDDVKNMVYYVVDTTNQSVMAQQVFSLMILGSFANTGTADFSHMSANAGYKVVANQLSNWLSQISKDFDIGIKYTPNDKLTNEELEVALSTQLFDDRLIIEGNFGVIRGDNVNTSNANNLVGDVDITYRITKRLSVKAYNHTNIKSNYYLYSFENYSDFTQGVGISYSQSFDNVREIFTIHRKNKAKKQKNKSDDNPKSK